MLYDKNDYLSILTVFNELDHCYLDEATHVFEYVSQAVLIARTKYILVGS